MSWVVNGHQDGLEGDQVDFVPRNIGEMTRVFCRYFEVDRSDLIRACIFWKFAVERELVSEVLGWSRFRLFTPGHISEACLVLLWMAKHEIWEDGLGWHCVGLFGSRAWSRHVSQPAPRIAMVLNGQSNLLNLLVRGGCGGIL